MAEEELEQHAWNAQEKVGGSRAVARAVRKGGHRRAEGEEWMKDATAAEILADLAEAFHRGMLGAIAEFMFLAFLWSNKRCSKPQEANV